MPRGHCLRFGKLTIFCQFQGPLNLAIRWLEIACFVATLHALEFASLAVPEGFTRRKAEMRG